MLARLANLSLLTNISERPSMSRRTQPPMSNGNCGHVSPVLVEELGGGKQRAKCLQCGECGEVREGTEEALRALRDRARERDEAQSA
jgi:hypothetical protein